jgi:iron complex outermembrane receptor protein
MGDQFTDIQNQIKQDTYTLLNSRLSIVYGQYSMSFWIQNITNERYLAYGNPDSSFGRQARIAQPRTVGITLSAKF